MSAINLNEELLLTQLSKLGRNKHYVIISHFLNGLDESLANKKSDIDILCDNNSTKRQIINLLGGKKIHKHLFSNSYWINYKNNRVSLDMFTINDGFYPKKWAIQMLKNGCDKGGLYYLSDIDYKYSCLYHNFFHKKQIDEKSLNKINSIFGDSNKNESQYLDELLAFMEKNNYFFVATLDRRKINNLSNNEVSKRYRYPLAIKIRHRLYSISILLPKKIIRLFSFPERTHSDGRNN